MWSNVKEGHGRSNAINETTRTQMLAPNATNQKNERQENKEKQKRIIKKGKGITENEVWET
jgi:hypothetical protein